MSKHLEGILEYDLSSCFYSPFDGRRAVYPLLWKSGLNFLATLCVALSLFAKELGVQRCNRNK